MKTSSYKDLIVWKKSVTLSITTHDTTRNFPREELYGLTSQMRRAAVSIASNVAEGRHRGTKKDYVQFLRIAYGSCAELETQIEIAKQLHLIDDAQVIEVTDLLTEVSKMLHVMIKKLQS